MGIPSRTFPFLLELDGGEVNEFHAELENAIVNGTTYGVGGAVDDVVDRWREKAKKNKVEADIKRRNELREEIQELQRKLKSLEHVEERTNKHNEQLREKLQQAGDTMDRIRYLVRRANDQCIDVDAKELGEAVGGAWKVGL